MQHYRFPPKFITIIQQLYENATCQVIHEGKLTEPFFVQTGGGGGGAVAQSVEHATPGEEVPGSIHAVAVRPYWLGRCQYNVTG